MRAAALGANDGIVWTARLIVGVVAANAAAADRERTELATQHAFEREEFAQIYVARGVDPKLALQVAGQMMAKDALGAHARDELGISEATTARPIQAALTSETAFSVGAAMPLAMVLIAPATRLVATCVHCLASVPCAAGCRWGESRRRQCAEGKRSRHILGRIGNGIYRWHRGRSRYSRLTQLPDL